MDHLSLASLAFLALGFVLKIAGLTTIQAQHRLGKHVFRWPEDAAWWGGEAATGPETEAVERAQAALRNDAENHPTMIASSVAWVLLGAPGRVVALAFGTYLLARFAHGFLLVHPRQPLRNRAYVVGQIVMVGITLDAVRRAIASL